jgi:hypothetical protein
MKSEHDQISQTLIYLHQDVFTLQERLKAIDQALQTILIRIDSVQKAIATEENHESND